MNKSHYLSIAFLAVIIGLIIYFNIRRVRNGSIGRVVPFLPGERNPSEPGQLNCDKDLKIGSRGEEVRLIQQWINRGAEGGKKITEDGIFGPVTESALRQATIESLGFAAKTISINEIPALREHCV